MVDGVGSAEVASSGANAEYVVQNPPPARLVLLSRMTRPTLFRSFGSVLFARIPSALPVCPAPRREAVTPVLVESVECELIASAMPCGPDRNGTTCCVPYTVV